MLGFILRDVMRTAHVIAGAVWLGGSIVYALALVPAFKLTGASPAVSAQVGAYFRRLVNLCVGVLVVSGVYLVFDRLNTTTVGVAYVVTLAAKVIVALAMIALAVYQAQEARRPAKRRGRLWRTAPLVILWLGVAAFLLGTTLTGLYESAAGH